jgi:hypothetical protein
VAELFICADLLLQYFKKNKQKELYHTLDQIKDGKLHPWIPLRTAVSESQNLMLLMKWRVFYTINKSNMLGKRARRGIHRTTICVWIRKIVHSKVVLKSN